LQQFASFWREKVPNFYSKQNLKIKKEDYANFSLKF
jgi:hypothetical protein